MGGRFGSIQARSVKRTHKWVCHVVPAYPNVSLGPMNGSILLRWDKVDLLRTVPGVGEQSSVTLLAPLPELGTLDRRHIAALGLGFLVWGLPPYHRLMMASRSVW